MLPNVDIDAGKKFNSQSSNKLKEIKMGNVPNLSMNAPPQEQLLQPRSFGRKVFVARKIKSGAFVQSLVTSPWNH
jgi:hypothetical protein